MEVLTVCLSEVQSTLGALGKHSACAGNVEEILSSQAKSLPQPAGRTPSGTRPRMCRQRSDEASPPIATTVSSSAASCAACDAWTMSDVSTTGGESPRASSSRCASGRRRAALPPAARVERDHQLSRCSRGPQIPRLGTLGAHHALRQSAFDPVHRTELDPGCALAEQGPRRRWSVSGIADQ